MEKAMKPFISIITPTVQRESLLKACASIDEQKFKYWEHIVVIDSEEYSLHLNAQIQHEQRIIIKCDHPHRNSGNTCRHNAWAQATGDYVFYLDDDNFLFNFLTLAKIESWLRVAEYPMWAVFPIARHGSRFFSDPPMPCHIDTGNIVAKREIGRWPDIPDYASDAIWVEGLKQHPYRAFPNADPIMTMPTTSFGAGGGINGE
jgi:glycosyltransferase involved in cell wall biosynthesis